MFCRVTKLTRKTEKITDSLMVNETMLGRVGTRSMLPPRPRKLEIRPTNIPKITPTNIGVIF